MSDWLHNLPIVWMTLLVFGLTALVIAAIYVLVTVLSVGERARSFRAVSPGMLPPLGILVALFIAFTAAQVWNDNDRAHSVVDRESSALRTVVILAATFPGEPDARLRSLIRSYVANAVAQEWPMMAHRTATQGMNGSAERYQERAHQEEKHACLIREMLATQPVVAEGMPSAVDQTV